MSTSNNNKIDVQKVQLFKNEKVLLITAPKIAHSWCRRVFLKNNNIDAAFEINTQNFNIIESIEEKDDDYFNEVANIWNLLLEKKEKRDLIILYRNPIEHFVSAFMQDWLGNSIHPNNIQYFKFFIESLPFPNYIKNNFIEDYIKHNSGLNSILITKYPEISIEIIKITMDYYLSLSKIENGHYTLWISFITKLFNSKKIDDRKIKFIDIYDNPLEVQLKNYINFDGIDFISGANNSYFSYSHEPIKKIINNNIRFKYIIETILKYEIIYYNEIKNKQFI